MKGKKKVASLTLAERGNLITVVTGTYVPLLIVFPSKNMHNSPKRD
jgi:hypothetical protein